MLLTGLCHATFYTVGAFAHFMVKYYFMCIFIPLGVLQTFYHIFFAHTSRVNTLQTSPERFGKSTCSNAHNAFLLDEQRHVLAMSSLLSIKCVSTVVASAITPLLGGECILWLKAKNACHLSVMCIIRFVKITF